MFLTTYKTIFASSICLLTIFAGLLPLHFASKHKRLLACGDAFASGVFFSAALLHLLPDGEESFRAFMGAGAYPIAQLICVVTFLFLLLIERGVLLYDARKQANANANPNSQTLIPYLLVLLISIHSLIEGAAIGITTNIASVVIIFFAVIAHKGSESFALASKLHHYTLSFKKIIKIILLFSLITPFGIYAASATNHLFDLHLARVTEAVFSAMAAGTFLYLGTMHMVEGEKTFTNVTEMFSLILGILFMGAAAIFV